MPHTASSSQGSSLLIFHQQFFGVLVGLGLDGLAPAVCFGGDTTTFDVDGTILAMLIGMAVLAIVHRMTQSSAVVLVLLTLSFAAGAGAAIVQIMQ